MEDQLESLILDQIDGGFISSVCGYCNYVSIHQLDICNVCGESFSFMPELYVHIEDTFLSDDMKDTVYDESDSDIVHKIVLRVWGSIFASSRLSA